MKYIVYTWLLLLAEAGFAQSPSLALWYREPAGNVWENALPVGNGRLGAMVYGNVEKDIIQLNEHTLWSGSPNRNKLIHRVCAVVARGERYDKSYALPLA